MKKKIIIISLLLSTFIYAKTGEWAAKVNNKVISQKEFAAIYNTQLSIMEIMSNYRFNASQLKDNKQYQMKFIEEYVANQLLLDRIKRENKKKKFVKSKWLKYMSDKIADYIENQLYMKNYMEKILMPKIGKITDEEISRTYEKHKDKFKNISTTKAAKIIRERLKQQKAIMLLAKLRQRVKNEARIKINYSIFEKK